jgi:hypothetical protein
MGVALANVALSETAICKPCAVHKMVEGLVNVDLSGTPTCKRLAALNFEASLKIAI